MARIDNYQVQAQQAKAIFLGFDQEHLIHKLKLQADETYVYVKLLCKTYRIHRATGNLERFDETWVDANTHGEVMTLMDLVCDSRPDRHLAYRWKNMQAFGLMFHQNLSESRNPFAEAIDADPEGFRRACLAMEGKALSVGDMSFAIEVFEGLHIAIQFWASDEEFPASVRYMWDENALMYLKYETMYFAVSLLQRRILNMMKNNPDA